MLAKSKLNSTETFVSDWHRTDWHRNMSWRIYYNFERERQIQVDEKKIEKCEWEIRRKTRKYDIK